MEIKGETRCIMQYSKPAKPKLRTSWFSISLETYFYASDMDDTKIYIHKSHDVSISWYVQYM